MERDEIVKRAVEFMKTDEGQQFFKRFRRRLLAEIKLGRVDVDFDVDLNKV